MPPLIPCRLLILTAIQPEFRAIASALNFPPQKSHNLWQNQLDITLALIGIRGLHLPQIAGQIQPQAIIMAGLAGALAPHLQIADLVYASDNPIPELQAHRGTITTSQKIIATPQEKAALLQSTGALAVDMETQSAAALAQQLHVPFVALRAISDTAADTLDPALLNMIDSHGNPRLSRAVGHLLAHPTKLPALLRIKQATDLALSKLAAAIVTLTLTKWPDLSATPTNCSTPLPVSTAPPNSAKEL